jgi:hypothetical protein
MTIPPAIPEAEAPEAVTAALAEVEAVEASLREARTAEREAEAAMTEAAALDKRLLADSRSEGRAHPGRPNRDKAEQRLVSAREDREADELRLADAREAVERAVREHAEQWGKTVAQAREKADVAFVRALSKLREVEDRRAELRAASGWLAARGTGQSLSKAALPIPGTLDARDLRNANSRMSVPYTFALLADYAERSSVAGELAAQEAAAEREAEQEQRREQMRQARQSLPG